MLFVAEMHLKSWQLVGKCALQKALKSTITSVFT